MSKVIDWADIETPARQVDWSDIEPTAAEKGGKPGSITEPESHLGVNLDLNELKSQLLKRTSHFLFGAEPGEPDYSPSTSAGEILGNVSIGAPGLEMASMLEKIKQAPLLAPLRGLIPSTESAGAKFNIVREAAKDVAVNTEEPYKIIQRAKELEATGHGPLSPGMTKLETALQPARLNVGGAEVLVNPPPITYPTSFDFASAAKNPSVLEKTSQSGMMSGQVKQFAGALQDANREAAAKVGMGQMFDEAMKEYSQAKSIEDAGQVLKKYGSIAAATAALGAVGYKAVSFLKEMHLLD